MRTRSEVQNGSKDQDHEKVRRSERQVGEQIGDGITEKEAENGDRERHQEGLHEQPDIDALTLRQALEAAIRLILKVDGCRQEGGRGALRCDLHRLPDRDIAPFVVGVQDRFLEGRLHLPGLARGRCEEGAGAGQFTVHAGRDPADGLGFTCCDQILDEGGVHRLVRLAFGVPGRKRIGARRHVSRVGIVVDALPQKERDWDDEAGKDEEKQGCHQHEGPDATDQQRLSQLSAKRRTVGGKHRTGSGGCCAGDGWSGCSHIRHINGSPPLVPVRHQYRRKAGRGPMQSPPDLSSADY